MSEIVCDICFRHCHIAEGKTGFCRARMNRNGENVCVSYGRLTALAMDPVEKKPLARFHPGSWILSAGSYGCNLSCPFCQNHEISMRDQDTVRWYAYSAEELAEIILREEDNLGIAFTYNEPLIAWEYARDVAALVKPHGKKIVFVSNGCVSDRVLDEVLPFTDAVNIDLKGDAEFYRELGGDYDMVRHAIERFAQVCHTEVTILAVPGKSDSAAFVEEQAKWLAGIDPDIVLHISRYFPRYRYTVPATDPQVIYSLQEHARKYLRYVYTGNV